MQPQLEGQLKQEEFDRKEFGFGRKMLLLQRKEALVQHPEQIKLKPVRIETDTKVKNEAYIIESRIECEKELKELKKRKIDKMVADKKLKAQELQLKDPEETNYLRKVLEKSKKKKLKDLIFKHQAELGLTKFFARLTKELRDLERQHKLIKKKSVALEESPEKPLPKPALKQPKDDGATANAKLKKVRYATNEQQDTEEQQSSPTLLPSRLSKTPAPAPEEEEQKEGTELLLQQYQALEARRQRQEIIEKYQKKAHNVVSLVVDAIEKKVYADEKLLKKLIYKRKGQRKPYIDEDEMTVLNFTKNHTELGRSTHLLKIKRYT